VYAEGGLLQMGAEDRIDADRRKPLMMKFQHLLWVKFWSRLAELMRKTIAD